MFKKISVGIALAAATLAIASSVLADVSNGVANRAPLAKNVFTPLPLGSIRAHGWLLKQLELQKSGLTGNAEEVYPELGKNSAWLGGKAPDSDWERPTYYTRGLIPLAYTLGDARLIAKAKKWMDAAIKSQRPDGSFGPESNGDWWARMPMLTALEDYYEASGDKRVITFLERYFKYQDEKTPDGLGFWGAGRAADNIQAVIWLYNRNGDKKLLAFMDKVRKLTEDWTTALLSGSMGDSHGVNVAEGFKMPPVWYQRSLDPKDKAAFMAGHDNAMRLHGQVHDLPSCTEFMAGRSSLQGVELCSIVDRIYSDGIAMDVLGDAKIGDIKEKYTFNALPGATSRNMHQHQYYVIPNQAQNVFGPKGIYGQDYENALCPSTRSGVPCCCFNWHMGWPKYVQYSWAATSDGGLAVLTYGPMEVKAKVAGGVQAAFAEVTNYPFDEQIKFMYLGPKSAKFPLKLRIPEWCKAPVVKVNGVVQAKVMPQSFFTINRIWKPGDVVLLNFPMELKITNQINDSIAIERGPLVFSLKIGENWVKRVPMTVSGQDFSEYEVKPTTPWNYGLIVDQDNLAASITVNKKAMPVDPFVQADAPITLSVKAKKIPSWEMAKNGLPEEVPQGPLNPATPVDTVTLVPFGAENIRITYFPVISSASPARGLTGEYFNGIDFKELRVTKIDPSIDLHFGTGAPDPAVSAEKYCIRWTGQIKPRYSGASVFVVTANGNAQLWIDGKQVQQLMAHVSGMQAFRVPERVAGKWYDIKLEFTKADDMADVSLQWRGDKQPLEVVPATCLRPREASGLEVQYKFDDNGGAVAADSSGYGRDAKLTNRSCALPPMHTIEKAPADGADLGEGKSGSSLVLDSDKKTFLTIPELPRNCKDLTMSLWVNLSSLGREKFTGVVDSGMRFPWLTIENGAFPFLSLLEGGAIEYIGSSKNQAMPQMSVSQFRFQKDDINKWRHIALVLNVGAKTANLYIDGMLDSTASIDFPNGIDLSGSKLTGGGAMDTGKIDDFRIYSRALDASEIAAIIGPMPTRGVRAQYYTDHTFDRVGSVSFEPYIRDVREAGSSGVKISHNAEFIGQIVPRYSETYTFSIASKGAAFLELNGKELINDRNSHPMQESAANVVLEAGKRYDFRMHYYSDPPTASANLKWSSPSQKLEDVPQSCLYPPADAPMPNVAWYRCLGPTGGPQPVLAYGQSETEASKLAREKAISDSSLNFKTAKINGNCKWVPDALDLSGDGYVSLPEGIVKGCRDITVASWVKINSNRGWARLFDFGDGPMVNMFLSTSAGPGLRFAITKTRTRGEQRIDAPVRLPVGEWKHLAVTLSGNVGIIYVDGVEVGRSAALNISPVDLGATKQNYIGKSQYNDSTLDGQIADFRVYNWALAPENIMAVCMASKR